jgi:hypothetical protein
VSPGFMVASIVSAVGAATLLGCCGSPTSTGTLTGTFKIVTGGVEYQTVPGAGRVIIRQGRRRLADHQVSSGSTFKITLPPGSYLISATCVQSPQETQMSTPQQISIETKVATRTHIQCLLNPSTGQLASGPRLITYCPRTQDDVPPFVSLRFVSLKGASKIGKRAA